MNAIKNISVWSLGAVVLSSVLACGSDFDPRTTLSDYRVIGVEASPPELAPDGTVTLQLHDYNPTDEAIAYEWSLCAYSLGAGSNFECASSEYEQALAGQEASVTLDLGPDGLDFREVLEAVAEFPNADGSPRRLSEGLDVWIRVFSGPDCRRCERVQTVKRLRLREGADGAMNANPVIERFEVRGRTEPGETVTLRVAHEAPERYTDPLTGESMREEMLFTWYTSEGETEPALTFGSERETTLQLPDRAGVVDVMVAVRDGRGGLAVASQEILVE